MSERDDFFRSLGVEPPSEEDDVATKIEKTKDALRDLVEMVCVIRNEAISQGMTNEEAFELASAYYNMFLGVNFMAAQYHVGMDTNGEG